MIEWENAPRPNEDKVKYRLLDRSEPARFSADDVIGLNKSAAPFTEAPEDQTLSIALAGALNSQA